MTITYDAPGGGTGAGDPLAWNHTCGGLGRMLIVGVCHDNNKAIVTVTYNAVTMTKLDRVDQNNSRVELWYLANPASGVNEVSVDLSAAVDAAGVSVSLTSCVAGAPRDSNTDNGNGQAPSHIVAGSLLNDIVVSVLGQVTAAGRAFTAGAGQTERQEEVLNVTSCGISTEVALGANTTSSWTIGGAAVDYAHISASFKTPPGGTQGIIIM